VTIFEGEEGLNLYQKSADQFVSDRNDYASTSDMFLKALLLFCWVRGSFSPQ